MKFSSRSMKLRLVAHALEQRLHIHHARLILGQTFPLVEVLAPAGDRTELGLHAVGQNDQMALWWNRCGMVSL